MPVRIETNPPNKWLVALSFAIVILAIVAHLTRIPIIGRYEFWLAMIGYAVLLYAALY
jgi:L-asparagine transporter-like permease